MGLGQAGHGLFGGDRCVDSRFCVVSNLPLQLMSDAAGHYPVSQR